MGSCFPRLQPLPQKELQLLPWLVRRLGHFWREDGWVWGLGEALHIAESCSGDQRVCQGVQELSHGGRGLHQPQKPPRTGSQSLAQPSGRGSAGRRKTEKQRTVLCQDLFLPCMGPRSVAVISDPRTVWSWLVPAGHKLSGTELCCARPSPEAELHHVNHCEWKRNPTETEVHSTQRSEHGRPRAKLAMGRTSTGVSHLLTRYTENAARWLFPQRRSPSSRGSPRNAGWAEMGAVCH